MNKLYTVAAFIILCTFCSLDAQNPFQPDQLIIQTDAYSNDQLSVLKNSLNVTAMDIEGIQGSGLEQWSLNLPIVLVNVDGTEITINDALDALGLVNNQVQSNSNNGLNYIISSPSNVPSFSNITNFDPLPFCSENFQISTGLNDVKMAIIDSGIDPSASFFSERVSGTVHYNLVDESQNIYPATDHGTIITSIIDNMLENANQDNAMLSMYQIFDAEGKATLWDLIKAFHLAISNDVDIIQLAIGYQPMPADQSDFLKGLIENASNASIFVSIAAGNNSFDLSQNEYFPAGFNQNRAFVISSSNCDNELSSFSNFSNQAVSFAVPGTNVQSYLPDGNMALSNGTSQASAILSACLAQLKSIETNPNLIYCAINNSLSPKAWLEGKTLSGSLLWDLSIAKDWLESNSYCGGSLSYNIQQTPQTDYRILEKSEFNQQLQVFPNPFSEMLSLNLFVEQSGPVNVELYNLDGKLVFASQEYLLTGQNSLEYASDIMNTIPGFYLLKVTQQNKIHLKKIGYLPK